MKKMLSLIQKNKFFIALSLTPLLLGCAHHNKNRDLQSQIYQLQQEVRMLKYEDFGLLGNQQAMNDELSQLHDEAQAELNKLRQHVSFIAREVVKIKDKTDKFNVRKSSNTLLFEPVD